MTYDIDKVWWYGCLENCQDLSYSAPGFKVTQKVIFMPKIENILKNFGPGGLRSPPVVAVASVAGHCFHWLLSFFPLITFNILGTHIMTQLNSICKKDKRIVFYLKSFFTDAEIFVFFLLFMAFSRSRMEQPFPLEYLSYYYIAFSLQAKPAKLIM